MTIVRVAILTGIEIVVEILVIILQMWNVYSCMHGLHQIRAYSILCSTNTLVQLRWRVLPANPTSCSENFTIKQQECPCDVAQKSARMSLSSSGTLAQDAYKPTTYLFSVGNKVLKSLHNPCMGVIQYYLHNRITSEGKSKVPFAHASELSQKHVDTSLAKSKVPFASTIATFRGRPSKLAVVVR